MTQNEPTPLAHIRNSDNRSFYVLFTDRYAIQVTFNIDSNGNWTSIKDVTWVSDKPEILLVYVVKRLEHEGTFTEHTVVHMNGCSQIGFTKYLFATLELWSQLGHMSENVLNRINYRETARKYPASSFHLLMNDNAPIRLK